MITKIDSDAAFPIHEEENGMYSLKIDPVLFNVDPTPYCDPNTKLLYNSVIMGSVRSQSDMITSIKIMIYIAKIQKFKILAISEDDKAKENLLDHIGNLLESECVILPEIKNLKLKTFNNYVILINDANLLKKYLGNNNFSTIIRECHAVILMNTKQETDYLFYKTYYDFKFPGINLNVYGIEH